MPMQAREILAAETTNDPWDRPCRRHLDFGRVWRVILVIIVHGASHRLKYIRMAPKNARIALPLNSRFA
jgi:hypothetical protein